MIDPMSSVSTKYTRAGKQNPESGFSLVELLISACVLLIISASVFSTMAEVQRLASYQTEVQAVLDNTRIAMQLVKRLIQQAGNDPFDSGLTAITIVSPTAVQIQADRTGSAGPGNPDKGDPDGDINDSGENITIRFNERARRLEVVPSGGSAQIVADYISGFSLEYFDASGSATTVGPEVRKVSVSISGASALADPQTQEVFGIQLSSDVCILT